MTRVAAVKADSYNQAVVGQATEEAINLLGGIANFIKSGDKVLIKPNMLEGVPSEKAVTTHPEVVRAIIRQVKAAGGMPCVGDSPALGSVGRVAEKTGIAAVCLQENVPLVSFDTAVSVPCPHGRLLKRFELAQVVQQADKVISVAKMKTHSLTGITGGIKNLFGCLIGPYKAQMHLRMQRQRDFAAMLADLSLAIQPVLYIIDGVIGMEGNGPRNGNPINTGVIIAGTNGFAVDMVMAKIMGFDAKRLPVTAWAIEHKLVSEPAALEVVGSAATVVVPYKAPKNLAALDAKIPGWLAKAGQRQLTAKPVVNDRCVGCGRCAAHCPPSTINIEQGKAVINYGKCIRCYCCQELCPYDAIELKESVVLKLIKRLYF